jgi:hypothetical protein
MMLKYGITTLIYFNLVNSRVIEKRTVKEEAMKVGKTW